MNPTELRAYHERVRAERARRSFYEFAKQAWEIVDPRVFVPNWHAEAICDHLQAQASGDLPKLLINLPPGLAKSILVSVLYPVWRWIDTPWWQVICASYADDIVRRDSIKARELIQSEWYTRHFRAWDFAPDQNTTTHYKNTAKGHRQSVTSGGAVTGLRGDSVVIDDPLSAEHAYSKVERDKRIRWMTESIPSRVNVPSLATFTIIMQRLHEEDPSGYILSQPNRMGYEHLCLPAEFDSSRRCVTYIHRPYWIEADGAPAVARQPPEKFYEDPRTQDGELLFPRLQSRADLEGFKTTLRGAYPGQYNQRPTAAEGGLFKRAAWRFWRPEGTGGEAAGRVYTRPKGCTDEPAVTLPPIGFQIGSLDAAFRDTDGSDYNVFTVWGVRGVEWYLLDYIRRRMDFDTTKKVFAGCAQRQLLNCPGCAVCLSSLVERNPRCRTWVVETKANGDAIVNSLASVVPGLIGVDPQGGKEARAAAMQPAQAAGQYFLPDGAPYLDEFVDEFANFPLGKNDDIVDSTSQAHIHVALNPDVLRFLSMVTM